MGVRTASLLRGLSIPLLRDLAESEVELLLGARQVQHCESGDTIVVQGDRLAEMFIVVSGKVRVTTSDGFEERTVAELGPGACFGEMRLLTGRGASATVTAVTSVDLLVVSGDAFREALARSTNLSRNIGMILAERLRVANRRSALPDEGVFVPVLASARREAEAQRLALSLAVSMARQSARRVLLVVVSTADRPSAIPPTLERLASLSELRRSPALLAEHDRPSEARPPLWGIRIVEERLDGATPPAALDDVVKAVAAQYDYVVAAMPGELLGALRAMASRARRVVALVGDGDDAATLAAAERVRDAAPQATVRAVAPGPDDTVRDREVGAIARDVLGLKVGIALGSGGAKGYAHIGVLEALGAAGVPVDCIAGCSIGSVVGSLWALGHGPDDIERLLDETRRYAIRFTLPIRSLLSSRGIERHIRRTAAGRRFEDAAVPLAVVAVDLLSLREVVFRSGPLWPAILASSSLPGIYPPVTIGDARLVDGGVINPVPITTAASLGADVVIGVKLAGPQAATPRRRNPNIVDTLLRSSEMMQARINDETAARATVLIEPVWPKGAPLGMRGFSNAPDGRAIGRAAVEAAIPRLRSFFPGLGADAAHGSVDPPEGTP